MQSPLTDMQKPKILSNILQDLKETWYTNDPDFTTCFQKTALIWIPCAFLWLFSPLEIVYLRKSINRNISRGFLNVTKLILTAALIILSAVDLIISIVNHDNDSVPPVDFYSPVIKIATFVSQINQRNKHKIFRIFNIDNENK